MICDVCGAEITKGCRYQSPRYKQLHFCSEACYNTHLTKRDIANAPAKALNDLLKKLYEDPNWEYLKTQCDRAKKKYDLTDDELRGIIAYATQIEEAPVKQEYGIGQWIPKYIEPYQQLKEQFKKNQKAAEDIREDEVVVIKPSKQVAHRWRKDEWDE